jgi:hypothetical protein
MLNITVLIITISGAIIYYKRIKKLKEEYNAKEDIIKNITLGISRNIYLNIRNVERNVKNLKAEITDALIKSEKAIETSEKVNQNFQKIIERIEKMENMVVEIKGKIRREPVKIDIPIPIDDQEILHRLNETEINILLILNELEEGTVPEIRKKINKTREHTARMLKKLYDRGFIDRNTSAMPYRYYLRKEVKEIIKRRAKETKSTLNV